MSEEYAILAFPQAILQTDTKRACAKKNTSVAGDRGGGTRSIGHF